MPKLKTTYRVKEINSAEDCLNFFRFATMEQNRLFRMAVYKKIIDSPFLKQVQPKVIADIYYNLGCDHHELATEVANEINAAFSNHEQNPVDLEQYRLNLKQFTTSFYKAKSDFHNAEIRYTRLNRNQTKELNEETLMALKHIDELNLLHEELMQIDQRIEPSSPQPPFGFFPRKRPRTEQDDLAALGVNNLSSGF